MEESDKKEVAKLKVRKFNNNVSVDIRKYYDNGSKPTPKGVSLKPDLFGKLCNWKNIISECCDLVEGKIAALKERHTFVSLTTDDKETVAYIELDAYHKVKVYLFKKMLLVDIRSYYSGGPTKKGISVSPETFEKIVNVSEWKDAVKKLSR